MQRGDTQYDNIGMSNVNANDGTTIEGKFKCTGRDSYLLVYIEAIRTHTAYFIDDFKIEDVGDDIPKQTGTILQKRFRRPHGSKLDSSRRQIKYVQLKRLWCK